VKTNLRKASVSLSRSNGWWLTLLLLLVVLVPSVCLFWFMNQAVHNERLAVRQKLVEAYRGHLSLARERLDTFWRQAAGELDARAEKTSAPALFAQEVRAGRADSVVGFYTRPRHDEVPGAARRARQTIPPGWPEAQRLEATDLIAGAQAYARIAAQATNVSNAALALQSQARCLVKSGKKDEAISLLTGPLWEDRLWNATDAEGRLIVPNTELMAIELVKGSSPGKAEVLFNRLEEQLLNYDSVMSSAQRRFLMRELQRLFPKRVSPAGRGRSSGSLRRSQRGRCVRPGFASEPSAGRLAVRFRARPGRDPAQNPKPARPDARGGGDSRPAERRAGGLCRPGTGR
jgi:hypothetical protein